jgi:transposase
MLIVGCDYHPGFQQIAFVDTDTGEFQERRLQHREEAERFYRDLAARGMKVRIGIEASGQLHSSFLRVPNTQGEDCEEDSSEAKLRSERDSQIVKRSVVQVDFIACLQSQSERSPEALKTGAGIHGKVRPGTSNSGNRVAKIA